MFVYQACRSFLWNIFTTIDYVCIVFETMKTSAQCYYCLHGNNFVGNRLLLKLARNELALNIYFCRAVFHSEFSIGRGGGGGFGLPKINAFRRLRDFRFPAWKLAEMPIDIQCIYLPGLMGHALSAPRRPRRFFTFCFFLSAFFLWCCWLLFYKWFFFFWFIQKMIS